MEQNQNQSLFGLNIDAQSKSFLAESAKWGKFLAIIGFVICGLVVVLGIFMATQISVMNNAFNQYGGSNQFRNMGPIIAVGYIIVAVIYFFPCLYLLRFSNHMKAALAAEDQGSLTGAFQNLKSMFKFVGIFTLIILSLYVLAFLIGIASRV